MTETHVLVVQMTISSWYYKSPQNGIDLLWDFFPAATRELQWCVVFIGPDEARIKAVAEEFIDELRTGKKSLASWTSYGPFVQLVLISNSL